MSIRPLGWLILVFLVLDSLTSTNAQTLIATGNTPNPFIDVVFEIDIHTCEERELFRIDHSFGLADIVYAHDGYFYGPNGNARNLIKIDPDDGSLMATFPTPAYFNSPNGYFASITVLSNGNLLLGGRQGSLVEFKIEEEQFGEVFYFDLGEWDNWNVTGIGLYKDRVFMSSPSRTVGELTLENLELDVTFDNLGAFIQALQVLEADCGEPYLVLGTAENQGLIHVFPDCDSFFKACDFSLPHTTIYGLTSYTEHLGFFNCRDTIDLNSTESGFDHFFLDECGLGRASIAHDSVRVYGDFLMDSIRVMVLEEPEPGTGRLETGVVGGVAVSGGGTAEMLAAGMVDFEVWEAWLKQLEYINTADPPVAGIRRIAVVGYFNGGETTDTAWAEIEIVQPDFSAGVGAELEECPTGELVNIFDYLSGADEGGRWEPEVAGGSLELLPANSGTYLYIVDHPECGSDTATLELFVWPGPEVGIEGGGPLCAGQSTTLELTGELSVAVSYLWSTGSTESQIEISEGGIYWVRMVYGEDCIWSDTVEVTMEVGLVLEEETGLCPGQILDWQGQVIEEAGEYETVLPGQSDECDTLLVLTVYQSEWISREMAVDICPGETYEIMGEELTEPGQYEFIIPSDEGCDTLLSIQLAWSDLYEHEEMISICPGEVYEIVGEELTEPGQYEFIIPSDEGCDTLLSIQLTWSDLHEREELISICPGEVYEIVGEELTEAGQYEFILPSESGCDTLLRIVLEEANIPEAEILGPDRVCEGEEIELIAVPEDLLQQVFWNTGQTGNKIKVTVEGWYSFEAFTVDDCAVYAEKRIEDCPSRNLYIPNAFSPNEDGVNDEWRVYTASKVELMELSIYNRWGGRVHEEVSPAVSWDGMMRGEELPAGNYVFHLRVLYFDGHEEVLSGDLLLVK